jgi:hypothetical protein
MSREVLRWFLFMLAMTFVMRWQGSSLVTPVSANGILALEFARTRERVMQLKAVWEPASLWLNIGLDLIYIISYTQFFRKCSIYIANRAGWSHLGRGAAVAALTAGCLDLAENISMLLGFFRLHEGSILAAYICATVKFLLLAIITVFLLLCTVIVYKRKGRPDKTAPA